MDDWTWFDETPPSSDRLDRLWLQVCAENRTGGTVVVVGTPRGSDSTRWFLLEPTLESGTEDRQAPEHAEPLAPLPDWLEKVDRILEGE